MAMVRTLAARHRSKDFVLSPWPVNRPRNWTTLVDGGLSEEELQEENETGTQLESRTSCVPVLPRDNQ